MALVAGLAGACVGSVDREEFEREIQERGGGISQDLPIEAVAALENELDVDEVEVRSMTVSNEHVVLVARSPEFPDEFDSFNYRADGFTGDPEPSQTAIDDPEQQVYDPRDIELDQLDDMVDQAIDEADLRGYAQTVTITRPQPGEPPVIDVSVTNERGSVSVRFGPDGGLIGIQ